MRNPWPILLATGLMAWAAAATAAVDFQVLPNPAGNTWSSFSLSSDGTRMACNFGGEVYLWAEGNGYTDLGAGDALSSSIGISADGTTICASRTGQDGYRNPAIWSETDGWTDLGHPPDGCTMDGSWGSGYAVSGDGSVAVGLAWYCPGAEGFVWTGAGGMSALDHPDGASSRASSISADGETIVGFYEHPDQGFRRAARWVSGGAADLFAGSDVPGEATAVTSDGATIVGQVTLGYSGEAFSYTDAGGIVRIGTLSGSEWDQSIANGVSEDGKVIGWSGDPFWGGVEAFLWTAQAGIISMRQFLNDEGAGIPDDMLLTDALAISADGLTIVGLWQDLNWNTGIWMAKLSEPTPVFMADFAAHSGRGFVDLSFRVMADARAGDFQLVGRSGDDTWTVSVEAGSSMGDGSTFTARDASVGALRGGTITYDLYYLADGSSTLVGSETVSVAPGLATRLMGARPNPLRIDGAIAFELARTQQVRIRVADVAGRTVRTLVDGSFSAGSHEIVWDGRDSAGREAPSGIYLVRMDAEDAAGTQRVSLIR